jgi:hypothetical protein
VDNTPTLKNRFTGPALSFVQLSLAKVGRDAAQADNDSGRSISARTEMLEALALRTLEDPSSLTLADYALILHLKHGVTMLYCKKALFLADGDIAKAEGSLRSGDWKRGLIF